MCFYTYLQMAPFHSIQNVEEFSSIDQGRCFEEESGGQCNPGHGIYPDFHDYRLREGCKGQTSVIGERV